KLKSKIMLEIKMYSQDKKPNEHERAAILNFLFENLEQYGYRKADIDKCMQYALKESNSFGGFILTAVNENQVVGAVIVNRTGMKDYIPENILVYIATDAQQR